MEVTVGNTKVGIFVPGKNAPNAFNSVTETFQGLIVRSEKVNLFFMTSLIHKRFYLLD